MRHKRASSKSVSHQTKKQAIIFIIALSFFLGIIFGVVFAVLMETGQQQRLTAEIRDYFSEFNKDYRDGNLQEKGSEKGVEADLFRNASFKYGKIIVIIWFLSFVPPTACLISTSLISAARGAGYGFTTALLLMSLGSTAFGAVAVYLPQFFITVPTYFIMSCLSINFSLKAAGNPTHFNAKESFTVLLGGMCFALLAAAIDAFLSPLIMSQTNFIR